MKRFLLGASSAVLAVTAGLPVAAETKSDTDKGVLEEIVVTAQRRQQSSQDVGLSLSVIGGEALNEKAVRVVNDIENVVPNMEVDSQFGSGQPQFRIRGIGAREYSSNNASTVGVYVDEVAHPYTITTQGAMFDIARIEVLRGPQGTLYGRNTTGGAVNIITNAPTAETHAGMTAEYGSYDRYKLEGFVSGQIAPGLLGRLAAVTEQGGAWQYNRDTGEKLGDTDKSAVRGRLTWDALDDVTVDVSATYQVDKSDGLGFRLRGPYTSADGKVTYPADTARRITGWQISSELAAVAGRDLDAKPGRDNDGLNLAAHVQADLGWADLTSITAYQNFSRSEYNDWDGTRLQESDVYFYNDLDVFSQELRLSSHDNGPLDWMIGTHYADESIDGGFYTQFRGIQPLLNTPYDQDVQAVGIFTHNSYAVTDRLNLIAGLRYEYEERSLTTSGTRRLNVAAGPEQTYDTDLSEFSGRAGVEYKVTDGAMLYANVSRGVKSGGFTTYNGTSATPFKPEIVIAYEAGVKSEMFDRQLQINGALFYYDYKDQQVQGLEYDRDSGRLGKITNVPKSEIYGGEVELLWVPIEGLTIAQNFGYKKGKYTEYFAIDGTATDKANPPNGPWTTIISNDRSGEPLQFPKFNYGGSVSYDWTLVGFDWRAETNYNKRDAIYSAASSSVLPGYWLLNASFSMSPTDSNWRFAVWGRNLSNTYYEETRNGFNGSARPTASPSQGRTLGVRLTVEM
ncbi:TonB-dependent receptor [Oleisolibacter albus]|uniref:TonB-dependent receptor n=1 Tax=Oleisolibacter albus TaxID=2171757 RepID=UPI000DF30002|nr:TonB-dependent receptor [Oleisolibacter albus]